MDPYPVKDPSHVIHFELRSQTAFKLCDSSSLLFLFTKTLIKKDYFPFNISVKYFNFITLKIETPSVCEIRGTMQVVNKELTCDFM